MLLTPSHLTSPDGLMPVMRSGMWGILGIGRRLRRGYPTGREETMMEAHCFWACQHQVQCDINFGPSPHLEPYLATKESTPSNETGVDSRWHRDCL